MKQKSSIKSRIIHYINFREITKYEFYKTTGITRGILDQDNGITETNILKFIHGYQEVSIVWLIVGEGNMLAPNLTDSQNALEIPSADKEVKPSYTSIPLIPIDHLSAFLLEDHSKEKIKFQTNFIETQFSDADFFTRVRDLSLFPLYNSGDFIACKIIRPSDFIQWNKIYLLTTNQGIIVKRIIEGKDEHHFKMSSDNPSFHSFEISREEIKAMAIVRGGIHLE